jgi:hypothetical protein
MSDEPTGGFPRRAFSSPIVTLVIAALAASRAAAAPGAGTLADPVRPA